MLFSHSQDICYWNNCPKSDSLEKHQFADTTLLALVWQRCWQYAALPCAAEPPSNRLLLLGSAHREQPGGLSTSSAGRLDHEGFAPLVKADVWDLHLHHTRRLCLFQTGRHFKLSDSTSLGITAANDVNPQPGTGREKFSFSFKMTAQ